GGFGGADSSSDELRQVIRNIRQKTNKPFIINLYLDRDEAYVPVTEREATLRTALAPGSSMQARSPIPSTRLATSTGLSRPHLRSVCRCFPPISAPPTRKSYVRSGPTARGSSRRRLR